jgi:high-affinity K+ transport system ATPase subunit B
MAIEVVMVTADKVRIASAIASQVGIDYVLAEVLPAAPSTPSSTAPPCPSPACPS